MLEGGFEQAAGRFARSRLVIRVVVDKQDHVAGLWFLPEDRALPESARVDGAGAATGKTLPSYVDPASFSERRATVGESPWELPGLLALPSGPGPFPAVLLIAGSGPNDKNETIGPNQPFKDLAGVVLLASVQADLKRYASGTLDDDDMLMGASVLTSGSRRGSSGSRVRNGG